LGSGSSSGFGSGFGRPEAQAHQRAQDLGKRHVKYGVLPAHYDVVGQALLATLESGLGAEWTEQASRP
jgi:hemoglobin-like flavoprotein